MYKNIILIGFMGTGKTTVGKITARKIGWKFIDTDSEIEKRTGIDVSEIFNIYGEQYFRDMESKIVQEISEVKKAVIACGGGVIKTPQNISALKSGGIIFWLDCGVDTVLQHLKNTESRPLLKNKNYDDIKTLMDERREIYRSAANFTIDITDLTPVSASYKILSLYKAIMR